MWLMTDMEVVVADLDWVKAMCVDAAVHKYKRLQCSAFVHKVIK